MNDFSLNRFGKTLRWYVSVNFRRLSMCTVSAFVGTFLVEMLYLLNDHAVDTGDIANISGYCAFAFAMVIVIGISGMMANLNKKSARSSFLMLPASNMEKYLSLLVYVSVILPVCIFVSIALGDTLRMAVRAWLYGDPWLSSVPEMLSGFLPGSGLVGRLLFIALVVWAHSLYVLGATWLRRYSFVIATVVLVSCCALFVEIFIDFFWDSDYCDAFRRVCTVIYFLFAAFNYRASYHIFKRFQLITNKWTNYDVFKR